MPKYVALSGAHKQLKMSPNPEFSIFQYEQFVPLEISEIGPASAEFPVVFIKDENTGQFRLLLMTSLRSGENWFIKDQQWRATYLPALIRHYPFALMQHPGESGKAVLCLDVEANSLSSTNGLPILESNGELSEHLKAILQSLQHSQKMNHYTENYIDWLLKHQLLVAKALTIGEEKGRKSKLHGFYSIDVDKLEQLSDEVYLEARKSGFLATSYYLVFSLNNVGKLMTMAPVQEDKS